MARKETYRAIKDGFMVEFIASARDEFSCNVYGVSEDESGRHETLVSELGYPRFSGCRDTFTAWTAFSGEAVHIAKRELAEATKEATDANP